MLFNLNNMSNFAPKTKEYEMKKFVLIFVCLFAGSANATLIDFDAFSAGFFTGGTEDGFIINVDPNSDLDTNSDFLGPFSGVNSLHHATGTQSGITLSNGGLFTFSSLQAGGYFGGAEALTVIGLFSGGIVGTDIFSPPNFTYSLFSAVNLAGVTIDTLHIDMGPSHFGPTHIDNIIVDTVSISVPEPSTLAIFALGIMGLTSYRFKKQY